ncbi:ABC transporter substrate-binding protein [Bradyrhizobium sp.]|uniref:ABC transporter substrate-binding protein n=1 Tax=Bradyrhizobium sp. TaxID=376 RepID=UPI0026326A18|nr:ABC transporter substrate-binding protein [Bradyrhizobium sp.]
MKSFTATLLAAVAFAASCGAASAQISDDVVKIGVLTDMSSLYADATGKGSLTAVQMAVADYGGKVKGKPIEVVSADHQNKPDVGVSIARNWYDNDKVDAIFDVPTSSVALAISQLTREKNKILMNSGAGSSDLTGVACSPNTVHYTYDTYALSNVAGKAMVKRGEDTWFFVTADYAFGHALERDAANVVKESGGKVLGAVRHPLNSSDFSSFLLQAQASKAKVIALANAGGDTTNALKQAAEFGIVQGGQKMIALLQEITDTHSLGIKATQGLIVTDAFYWDMNDETRAFSKRFYAKVGKMPTMIQAGLYSATMHYLQAIDATGTDEAQKVMVQMRATPINDFFAKNGKIRIDGRMVHDMYLFEVKKPEESKGEWDLYKLLATVPGDEAFRPLDKGNCPLVKKD